MVFGGQRWKRTKLRDLFVTREAIYFPEEPYQGLHYAFWELVWLVAVLIILLHLLQAEQSAV